MRVFYERNYFLGESIDLSSVTSVVKGTNQCHNLVSSWIWMKQMQLGLWVYSLGSNQTGLSYYNDWCQQCFKSADQSSAVLSHWWWRPTEVGSETWGISARIWWTRLEGWKRVKSQMSSCDLIRFSITVSFNHSWATGNDERVLEGAMKERWRDLVEERDGVMAWCGCVWNAMNPGMSLRVFPPFSSYFTANPVDVLHLGKAYKGTWRVCVHVYFAHQHKVWQQ